MPAETTDLNVILLPDKETSLKAIELSNRSNHLGQTRYLLDGKHNHPHVTLYQSAFPTRNFDKINQSLVAVALQTKPIQIELNKFSSLLEFLFWDAVKSPQLLTLHQVVLQVLNPLRDGLLLPEDEARLELPSVSEAMKASIRLYGYPVAGDLYPPHITITRFNTITEAQNAVSHLPPEPIIFTVSTIALANRGQNGTVNELYIKYPLESL